MDTVEVKPMMGIASPEEVDVEMVDVVHGPVKNSPVLDVTSSYRSTQARAGPFRPESLISDTVMISADTPPASTNGLKHEQHTGNDMAADQGQQVEPPTPPMSLEGHGQSLPEQGGIPWYVAPFDPDGTTIYEERWTGPEILRDMSEELSEMDEDELEGLGPANDLGEESVEDQDPGIGSIAGAIEKKKMSRRGRRGRNSEWGTKSFRNRR
jgi:NuA3 HAT complex component NTO1